MAMLAAGLPNSASSVTSAQEFAAERTRLQTSEVPVADGIPQSGARNFVNSTAAWSQITLQPVFEGWCPEERRNVVRNVGVSQVFRNPSATAGLQISAANRALFNNGTANAFRVQSTIVGHRASLIQWRNGGHFYGSIAPNHLGDFLVNSPVEIHYIDERPFIGATIWFPGGSITLANNLIM